MLPSSHLPPPLYLCVSHCSLSLCLLLVLPPSKNTCHVLIQCDILFLVYPSPVVIMHCCCFLFILLSICPLQAGRQAAASRQAEKLSLSHLTPPSDRHAGQGQARRTRSKESVPGWWRMEGGSGVGFEMDWDRAWPASLEQGADTRLENMPAGQLISPSITNFETPPVSQ